MPSPYDDLPLRPLQAVALLGFQRWRVVVELADPGLDELCEHLWQWMTVEPATFDDWHRWCMESDAGRLEADVPSDLAELAVTRGIEPTDLQRVLKDLSDITHFSLFTVPHHDEALRMLQRLGAYFTRWGVTLPPPATFHAVPDSADGWGKPSSQHVQHWRTLSW